MKRALFFYVLIIFGRICVTEKKAAGETAPKIETFGPKEVSAAFGIPLSSIKAPPIPWTTEELAKARKEGRVLILRACPPGFPNTISTMGQRIPEEFKDLDLSACALREGWVLADIFPPEWTADKTYEEHIHETLKRGRTFKMLPETLYDALVLQKKYQKMKKNIPQGFFLSRTGSYRGEKNILVGITYQKHFVIQAADHLLSTPDIKMLTQSIK